MPSWKPYLALLPGRTLPLFWNLITAGFLVSEPVLLVLDVGVLLMVARLVEPVHGSKEFLK